MALPSYLQAVAGRAPFAGRDRRTFHLRYASVVRVRCMTGDFLHSGSCSAYSSRIKV